jgi:hypothetical protein
MLRSLSLAEDDVQSTSLPLVDLAENAKNRSMKFELGAVEEVGDVPPLHVAPEPFDQIEIGTVSRKPEDLEVPGDRGQEREDLLGLVELRTIADQDDLPSRSLGTLNEAHYQVIEAHTALGPADVMNDLPRREVKGAVDHPLLVLTRTRHPRLKSPRGPNGSEIGVEVEFGFVLVPEFEGRAVLESLFFSSSRRFWARRWAFSSRLPLSVCLGR